MSEYIEREAALNANFKIPAKRLDTRIKTARDAVQAYANYIADLPAADVQPVVRGKWVWTETGDEAYEQFWVCSVCGEHDFYEANYCPNCGARMDEHG